MYVKIGDKEYPLPHTLYEREIMLIDCPACNETNAVENGDFDSDGFKCFSCEEVFLWPVHNDDAVLLDILKEKGFVDCLEGKPAKDVLECQ